MAIPTTRTAENAHITISPEKCSGCGLCVDVCKDFSLELRDGTVHITSDPVFGCFGCGHCMAICPNGAIEIHGRTLTPDDLFELGGDTESMTYQALSALLHKRRSIREFKGDAVEPAKIQQILDIAVTAPMGLPPSDVHVMVLEGDKVRSFAFDFCRNLERMRWFISPWFLAMMRPFWGKANDELFRSFVRPLFNIYVGGMNKGKDYVTYEAPLVMYFYGSPYSDPADPIVAATYAMIAGETLGLGSCMLGGIHPLIQHGRRSRRFREKYGIRYRSKEGLFVIFGYPAVKYTQGIKRSFAKVHHEV